MFASGSRTATFGTRPSRRTRRTRSGQPENSAQSRWAQTVEGTLVAKASIVELSLVELDEQPAPDEVLPAKAPIGEARARERIFE